MIQRALLHANDTKGSQYKRSSPYKPYSSLNVRITIRRQREICFPPRLDGTGTPALWYTGTLALAHCHCGTRQSLCAQFAFDGLPFVDGYQCFFNGHYL